MPLHAVCSTRRSLLLPFSHSVSALHDPSSGGVVGLTYRCGRHLPGLAEGLGDVLADLAGEIWEGDPSWEGLGEAVRVCSGGALPGA
jgi:hypothetical protein